MNLGKTLVLPALLAGALSATPLTFNFNTSASMLGDGVALTRTVGGLTVNITAWSSTGAGGGFATARIGRYSGGLGVCNDNEAPSCADPNHAVDNYGSSDFLLFEFSQNVDLQSFSLGWSQSDSDVSYFTGAPGFAAVLGKTTANLPGIANNWAARQNIQNAAGAARVLNGNGVRALFIGAEVGETNDYFKLNALTVAVAPPPGGDQPVPEPATMALLGLGLVGLHFWRKR